MNIRSRTRKKAGGHRSERMFPDRSEHPIKKLTNPTYMGFRLRLYRPSSMMKVEVANVRGVACLVRDRWVSARRKVPAQRKTIPPIVNGNPIQFMPGTNRRSRAVAMMQMKK